MSEITKEVQDAASAAGWAPPSRLAEIVKERNALTERVTNATAEIAAAKSLADDRAKALVEWEAKAATWAETEGIYRTGVVDPEDIAVARTLHGTLPAEGRPALPDWLTGIRTGTTPPPRALAHLAAAPIAAPPAPPKPGAPPPRATVPVATPATGQGTGKASMDELKAARAAFERGDATAYRALKAAGRL